MNSFPGRIRSAARLGYCGGIEALSRVARWLQRLSPLVLDGLLAALLFLLVQAQDPVQRTMPLSVAITAFETLPLTFRRRAPSAVLLVVAAASIAHLTAGFHNGFFDTFSVVVAVYSVAANSPRARSLRFLIVMPFALATALAIDWHNTGHVNLLDIPYNLLLFLSPWLLGDSLQTRRAYASQLEERERMLARERQDRTRAALAEERARIARELHDIVAHSVSVMVLQANAGERIVGSRPDEAARNFAAIQTTGRDALAELRRMLGVLRDSEGKDGTREPQPGLADVDRLVEAARQSGVDTTIRIDGDTASLPEAVQLQAYRIIQEALTNTLRHGGASRADIRVRRQPGNLDVEVVDDGRQVEPLPETTETGHGLIGMRERVQLFGGELQVGPRPEGGFRVSARFALDGRSP